MARCRFSSSQPAENILKRLREDRCRAFNAGTKTPVAPDRTSVFSIHSRARLHDVFLHIFAEGSRLVIVAHGMTQECLATYSATHLTARLDGESASVVSARSQRSVFIWRKTWTITISVCVLTQGAPPTNCSSICTVGQQKKYQKSKSSQRSPLIAAPSKEIAQSVGTREEK
jgi:hypothetical protein